MRRSLGVGEGTIGKRQSLVDPPEHPQYEGVEDLRCGAGIPGEPVGEIAMARLVVECDSLLKMVMGAGKISQIPAGVAANAMSDQGLGAIRLRCGFAQEKFCHFARRGMFATGEVPHKKTEIGGEPLRRVFDPARQFAGARKRRTGFRRRHSLDPDQRIAEAGL